MNVNYIYMEARVHIENVVEKLDSMGKPAWIGLIVLSFILFWPVGLALLAYLIWSGRMGHRKHGSCAGRWRFDPARRHRSSEKADQYGPAMESSGNSAFDEYRNETLKRLEQEQNEFMDFLERLRFAKDKSEFDQFLADRRQAQDNAAPPPSE